MLASHQQLALQVFRPPTRIAEDGTVEGYASLFGEVDAARDMVMPGAFARTLKSRGIRRVPMLFQHDPAEPVGVWLELFEDFRGLRARGKLIPDVARARELGALIRAGALDGLSIGFRTVKGRIDPATRVRKLIDLDLWEISIVTFPLLAGARVRAVKDLASGREERLYRRHPRYSFTRARGERECTAWQGATPLDARSLESLRTPSARRLETTHTFAQARTRRDRVRGWISEPAVRSADDPEGVFARPARAV